LVQGKLQELWLFVMVAYAWQYRHLVEGEVVNLPVKIDQQFKEGLYLEELLI